MSSILGQMPIQILVPTEGHLQETSHRRDDLRVESLECVVRKDLREAMQATRPTGSRPGEAEKGHQRNAPSNTTHFVRRLLSSLRREDYCNAKSSHTVTTSQQKIACLSIVSNRNGLIAAIKGAQILHMLAFRPLPTKCLVIDA